MSHPDSSITAVDQEESGPGASVSTEKVATVSQRTSTTWCPTVIGPLVLLGWKFVWGPPGTFGPDCLESLTPGAYTSEDSLFSSKILCRLALELEVA